MHRGNQLEGMTPPKLAARNAAVPATIRVTATELESKRCSARFEVNYHFFSDLWLPA